MFFVMASRVLMHAERIFQPESSIQILTSQNASFWWGKIVKL
jgi:hypothetical protein